MGGAFFLEYPPNWHTGLPLGFPVKPAKKMGGLQKHEPPNSKSGRFWKDSISVEPISQSNVYSKESNIWKAKTGARKGTKLQAN